jgi:cytochrome c-type biogenesis protein CcmE
MTTGQRVPSPSRDDVALATAPEGLVDREDADAGQPPPGLERPRRRLPFLVLGLAGLAAFLGLGISAFQGSVVYYLTPTEALDATGEDIRVSGTVVPGSIVFDSARGTVSFLVTDGTTDMPVVFEGAAPDTLKDEAEAVAEGVVQPDGTFQAVRLFARCASKFESEIEP